MAGRPRTRSDDEVFTAVGRALARVGLARLTLADVAAEAGLAPSTLAGRFGSKRALLLAASERWAERAPAAFPADGSPLEALHAGLAAMGRTVRTRPALARSLGMLQLDVADPAFRRAAARHAAAVREQLQALLDAALAAGELRAGADPAALARAVHVAYNGALVTWGVAGHGPLADALRTDAEAVLAPWRSA
jgi:AcrR family transcriptional regulator